MSRTYKARLSLFLGSSTIDAEWIQASHPQAIALVEFFLSMKTFLQISFGVHILVLFGTKSAPH